MTTVNDSEVFSTYEVGLPIYTWSSTLLAVCDRKIRLLEGIILRLINDNVSDVDVITQLLGLDDRAIVIRTAQRLVERGAISFAGGLPLYVTDDIGQEMLASSMIKDERRLENIQIAYDPLRRNFFWIEDRRTYIGTKELKLTGAHAIIPPYSLSKEFLPENFRYIQTLVRSEPEKLRRHPLGKDVILFELQEVLPARPILKFVRAKIEVSQHKNGEWTYRVLRKGGEDIIATDMLRAWESGGDAVLPLEKMVRQSAKPQVKEFFEAIAPLSRSEHLIAEEDEQRQHLREVILSANRQIVIAPVNGDLRFSDQIENWLNDAMNSNPSLSVKLGVEGGLGAANRPSRTKNRQLERFKALQKQHPGKIEIQEMINIDSRAVLVDGARFTLQTHETRSYGGEFLKREVVVPSSDATNEVGRAIKSALTNLFGNTTESPVRRLISEPLSEEV